MMHRLILMNKICVILHAKITYKTLHVIEYFAKSLKVIRNDTVE